MLETGTRASRPDRHRPERVPPLANPPFAATAHMGKLQGEARDKAAAQGARTVPPREHGGNCDIKDLSRGSKVFFPVYVDGAGLSVGDLHFSQGDGEITFCGAIEMAGWVHMRVKLIKGGMAKYGIKNPIFKPSPITPNYNDYLIFEGISVDEQGGQHYLDVTIAYRQACLNAIEYLKKFGYSARRRIRCSAGAGAGHISGVVDIRTPARPCGCPRDLRLRHQPERRRPDSVHPGRGGSTVFAGSREGVSDRLKSRRNRRLSCQSTTSNAQAAGRSPSCAASRIAKNRAAVPTAARQATASSARHRSR
jgi:hypothetical protein